MSPDELTQLLRNLIQRETEELRREVVLLRQDLALSRRVVTTSQATAFFDEYVKPGSLVGYIKYQGLPARKTGCLWHLYVQDIFDWQIGLIGHASTKKQGISNIVAPRHRHNAFVRMAAEQARLPQRYRDEYDLTTASKKHM